MVAAALAVVVALVFVLAAEALAASEEVVGQHKGKLKKQMEAVVMEVMLASYTSKSNGKTRWSARGGIKSSSIWRST